MQLELPKRLNSILPILKWNLTFYFRRLSKVEVIKGADWLLK